MIIYNTSSQWHLNDLHAHYVALYVKDVKGRCEANASNPRSRPDTHKVKAKAKNLVLKPRPRTNIPGTQQNENSHKNAQLHYKLHNIKLTYLLTMLFFHTDTHESVCDEAKLYSVKFMLLVTNFLNSKFPCIVICPSFVAGYCFHCRLFVCLLAG